MHYNLNVIGSLEYQFSSIWTTPWPDKISIFLKIEWANKSIFKIEMRTSFLGKLGGPFFLHCNLNVTGSLGYQFGSLYTTPWPDKISLFFEDRIGE